MTDKIKVTSMAYGSCGINNPDLRIRRIWPARGSSLTFTSEQIEELMYDDAFRNMVNEGMLYIEDMEVKKALGIEPEDATEPTIKLVDEKELNRLWKIIPTSQFKLETKKLTKHQINDLADYAIQHGNDGSIDKANYLTEISGRQILKGIELEKAAKEG